MPQIAEALKRACLHCCVVCVLNSLKYPSISHKSEVQLLKWQAETHRIFESSYAETANERCAQLVEELDSMQVRVDVAETSLETFKTVFDESQHQGRSVYYPSLVRGQSENKGG